MVTSPLRHLISAEALATIIGEPEVCVVDARWYIDQPSQGRRDYEASHLPGAVYASLDDHLSGQIGAGRHPLPSPNAFAKSLAGLGITPGSHVVIYDQRGGAIAARLWWMLTAQGHRSVAVLDGGIQAWESAGGGLEAGPMSVVRNPMPDRYPTVAWSGVVSRHDVATRSVETIVIDARAPERYRGDEEPVDLVAGHIPGAASASLTGNLDADERFLPSQALAERFSDLGLSNVSVISQCGSGVTACHNILAMEIAGFPRPDLYVGSWSDWSTAGMPIATGDTP